MVRPGELVGIAGVAGSGQRELCEVALGLRKPRAGAVKVNGTGGATPGAALGRRRRERARGPGRPTRWSPASPSPSTWCSTAAAVPASGLGIDWRAVAGATEDDNERLGLRMAAAHRRVSELSGGNIQRVLLTRELSLDARLVVAAYPSRGLDIANVRRTQQLLLERCRTPAPAC